MTELSEHALRIAREPSPFHPSSFHLKHLRLPTLQCLYPPYQISHGVDSDSKLGISARDHHSDQWGCIKYHHKTPCEYHSYWINGKFGSCSALSMQLAG